MTDSLRSADTELHAYLEALLTPSSPGESPPPSEPEPRPSATMPEPPPAGPEEEPLPPGCPDWLGTRFAVLIFTLGRLRFAAPVVHLRGAWELDDTALQPLSGPGLVGEVEQLGEDWIVLDTAALIVPGGALKVDYRWALPTALGTYALACEGVEREVEVAAAGVQWRGDRRRRPWLLGMVAGREKCPLLDIETLVAEWQTRSQR